MAVGIAAIIEALLLIAREDSNTKLKSPLL